MVSKLRENIKAHMALREMNEAALSSRSGVPQPTINRFLGGHHHTMYDKSVTKIANALGVSLADLRYGEPNAQTKQSYLFDSEVNSHKISGFSGIKDLYKEFSLNPDLIATLSGIKEHGIVTAIYTLINLPNRSDRCEALSEVITMLENQRELCRQEAEQPAVKAKI